MTALLSCAVGCAGRGPDFFPPAPTRTALDEQGRVVRAYDLDGDGACDVFETIGESGRIERVAYETPGAADIVRDRTAPLVGRARSASPPSRHVLIIVDSIPFEMVDELWRQGRFRLFYPPGRLVSPFPVMTDPALAEFFRVSPCAGVEARHFDGARLTSGFDSYLSAANMPWLRRVDWALPLDHHGYAYLWPGVWLDYELGEIQRRAQAGTGELFTGYVVGGSSLGSKRGRSGHQTTLLRLDHTCEMLFHRARGETEITLMSDHGHTLRQSQRIPLAWNLSRVGYRVGEVLERPGDVVVPEFGAVSCAAIHTRSPERVARDVIGFEGVALAAFRAEDGAIRVVARDGEAAIRRRDEHLSYVTLRGDPLRLTAALAALRAAGKVDADGFVADRDLRDATLLADYPDAVGRLWRAFDGLFVHTPDVYLSLDDGWFVGSETVDKWIDMAAVHGGLSRDSSTGFLMSTAGAVPAAQRMSEAASSLRAIGVPVEAPAEAR